MTPLLIPFLLADVILIWMLRDALRTGEVWMATRMERGRDNRTVWWMTVVRLAALLVLSLMGTGAALLA